MKKMAKMLVLAFAMVLAVSVGAGATAEAKTKGKVTSVQITAPTKKSTYTVKRGAKDKTVKLKYKVKATKGASKAVTFKSSKPSVVSVSDTGVMTIKKAGTAKITVTTTQNKKKDTLTVKVKQLATGITATVKKPTASWNDGASVTLTKSKKAYTITKKFTGPKPSSTAVSYKSSKKSVVTVNSKGKLYAKKAGTAKVYVTAKDGSKKKATITVKVLDPKKTTKVTSVTTDVSELTLNVANKKTATIKASVAPSKATFKTVAFYSSNEKVATVDETKGTVTAVAPGEAVITVKALDGSKKTATVKVVVKNDITAISASDVKVYVGKTAAVKAVVNSDAYDTTVTYSIDSASAKFATVDSKTGAVKGLARGTVNVTAKAANGKTAIIKLTVVDEVVTKVTPKQGATATATVTFKGSMTKIEEDIITLLQKSGLKANTTKNITVDGKSYVVKYSGKDIKFSADNGKTFDKTLDKIAANPKEVKVVITADAVKFVNGLQMASFVSGNYKYDVTIGGYTFTELNLGNPYITLKANNDTYQVYGEKGSLYFVGTLKADVKAAIEKDGAATVSVQKN